MNVVLKYETVFTTSLPILMFYSIFEMVPSWRELLKEKQNLLGQLLILVPAANLHCDILTLVSSRKK